MPTELEQRAKGFLPKHWNNGFRDWSDEQRREYAEEYAIEAVVAALQAQQPVTLLPAAEINALPEHVRKYIMWIESEADPAGTIRENFRLNEENAALRILVAEQEAQQPGAQAVAWPSIETVCKAAMPEDEAFSAWRNAVPDKHWTKLDLSALRVGYELGKRVHPQPPFIPEPSAEELCSSPYIEALTPTNDEWRACATVQDRYDLMERKLRDALTTYTARLRERIGGGA